MHEGAVLATRAGEHAAVLAEYVAERVDGCAMGKTGSVAGRWDVATDCPRFFPVRETYHPDGFSVGVNVPRRTSAWFTRTSR